MIPTKSRVEEVHRKGLLMNEAEGSAVVTGPVYPCCRTIDFTLVILVNNALAETQFYNK